MSDRDHDNIVSMPIKGTKKTRRRTRRQTPNAGRQSSPTTRPDTRNKEKTTKTKKDSKPATSRPVSKGNNQRDNQRVASLLHYRPKSDLVHELSTNIDSYVGEEWISCRRFPGHVVNAVDQVRKRVDGRTPGFNPTVACAVHLGLMEIEEHKAVLALRDIKDSLDLMDEADTDVLDSMYGWFRHFPISTSDSRMARVERRNVSMPYEIKHDLSEISGETGIGKAELVVVCCEVVLMLQPEVGKGYKVRFEESVNRFFKLASVRRRLGVRLVEVVEGWTTDEGRGTTDE